MTRHRNQTKTKPDVLAELERLDAALAEAEQAATEAGAGARSRRPTGPRAPRAAHMRPRPDPELVDHGASRPRRTTRSRKIDKQLAEVGDWNDLARRRDHARSIAEKKRGEVHRHVRENLDAILEGLTPEAEDVAAAVQVRCRRARRSRRGLHGIRSEGRRPARDVATIRAAPVRRSRERQAGREDRCRLSG